MSAQLFVSLLTILVMIHLLLLSCAYLILLERKVAAWVQNRIGPNRTNFSFGLLPFKGRHLGLGQALADGLKLFFKEDYTPPNVDRHLFLLAPVLAIIPALLGWAVIPWGGTFHFPGLNILGLEIPPDTVTVAAAPINIGVLFLLAVSSLAVYAVVLGAYASNNKYSFLGGLRATAQMLSYEIPMGLCLLIMVLTYQVLDTGLITNFQAGAGGAGAWGIFLHPLVAVIFFIAILAETNRAPVDLAEAEQELVGGFHTEYSSMKWALYFLAEYLHMITGCAFVVLLFLGGWDLLPFTAWLTPVETSSLPVVLLKAAIFLAKVGLLLFVMMWIRWTLPRLRFDQLMQLAWRGIIPITVILLLIIATLAFLQMPRWTYTIANVVVFLAAMFIAPHLPKGAPINRRILLEGSRFSAPKPAAE